MVESSKTDKEFKPDRIVSVFGTLGVGKSSCLNALMSREQLNT